MSTIKERIEDFFENHSLRLTDVEFKDSDVWDILYERSDDNRFSLWKSTGTYNSYNYTTPVGLQMVELTNETENKVITAVQIHYGLDIRGGYGNFYYLNSTITDLIYDMEEDENLNLSFSVNHVIYDNELFTEDGIVVDSYGLEFYAYNIGEDDKVPAKRQVDAALGMDFLTSKQWDSEYIEKSYLCVVIGIYAFLIDENTKEIVYKDFYTGIVDNYDETKWLYINNESKIEIVAEYITGDEKLLNEIVESGNIISLDESFEEAKFENIDGNTVIIDISDIDNIKIKRS